MNPPRFDHVATQLAALGLLCTMLAFMSLSRRESDTADELRIERKRRRDLEQRLRTREQQLDGALGKIHELHEEEADGDDIGAGEPA